MEGGHLQAFSGTELVILILDFIPQNHEKYNWVILPTKSMVFHTFSKNITS